MLEKDVIVYDFSCLSVFVCVTDVGVAVTNLRVVCKLITCVSAFAENGHNLSGDSKF